MANFYYSGFDSDDKEYFKSLMPKIKKDMSPWNYISIETETLDQIRRNQILYLFYDSEEKFEKEFDVMISKAHAWSTYLGSKKIENVELQPFFDELIKKVNGDEELSTYITSIIEVFKNKHGITSKEEQKAVELILNFLDNEYIMVDADVNKNNLFTTTEFCNLRAVDFINRIWGEDENGNKYEGYRYCIQKRIHKNLYEEKIELKNPMTKDVIERSKIDLLLTYITENLHYNFNPDLNEVVKYLKFLNLSPSSLFGMNRMSNTYCIDYLHIFVEPENMTYLNGDTEDTDELEYFIEPLLTRNYYGGYLGAKIPADTLAPILNLLLVKRSSGEIFGKLFSAKILTDNMLDKIKLNNKKLIGYILQILRSNKKDFDRLIEQVILLKQMRNHINNSKILIDLFDGMSARISLQNKYTIFGMFHLLFSILNIDCEDLESVKLYIATKSNILI